MHLGKTLLLASSVYISLRAFTPEIRRDILERDNFECQCCGRSGRQGYHLQAAHHPDMHQRGEDTNPENGRALCTRCHIVEEYNRGNVWGAKALFRKQTIRNYQWLKFYGQRDEKPRTFEQFIEEEVLVLQES